MASSSERGTSESTRKRELKEVMAIVRDWMNNQRTKEPRKRNGKQQCGRRRQDIRRHGMIVVAAASERRSD